MSIRNTAVLQWWAAELRIRLWGWWNCHTHTHTHTHTTQERQIVTILGTWGCDCMHACIYMCVHVCVCVCACVRIPQVHDALCPLPEGYQPWPCTKPTGPEEAPPPSSTGVPRPDLPWRRLQCCLLARTCVWHPVNCRCPASQHTHYLMPFPRAIIFQWGENRYHLLSREEACYCPGRCMSNGDEDDRDTKCLGGGEAEITRLRSLSIYRRQRPPMAPTFLLRWRRKRKKGISKWREETKALYLQSFSFCLIPRATTALARYSSSARANIYSPNRALHKSVSSIRCTGSEKLSRRRIGPRDRENFSSIFPRSDTAKGVRRIQPSVASNKYSLSLVLLLSLSRTYTLTHSHTPIIKGKRSSPPSLFASSKSP